MKQPSDHIILQIRELAAAAVDQPENKARQHNTEDAADDQQDPVRLRDRRRDADHGKPDRNDQATAHRLFHEKSDRRPVQPLLVHQYNVIPPRRRHTADDRPEEDAADPHELHEDDRDDQVRHRRRHSAVLSVDKNARRLAVDLHHALEVIGRKIIDDDDQHAVRQQVVRSDPCPDKRLEHR